MGNIWLLAGVLGCNVDSFPSAHLGLPVGARFKEKAIWDLIIERLEESPFVWKSRCLFKGGD